MILRNVIGLVFIASMMNSCSIFETRDPDEPGSTTVPVFIQPDRPQDVVQNLENAIRALNLDNYRRSLSQELFQYEPSSEAQSSNPNLWHGWGFSEEETYFNNMRSEAEGLSGHDIELQNRSQVRVDSDIEEFQADYTLTVEHNRQGLPTEARGTMRLQISREEDGIWEIISWEDASDGSDFTWSDFRTAFF